MSAEPVSYPVPICEVCWLKEHARWEPESVDSTGNILMRLSGVDVPNKVNNGAVDVCIECGKITVSGIYDLRDPRTVVNSNHPEPTFPRSAEEEEN